MLSKSQISQGYIHTKLLFLSYYYLLAMGPMLLSSSIVALTSIPPKACLQPQQLPPSGHFAVLPNDPETTSIIVIYTSRSFINT